MKISKSGCKVDACDKKSEEVEATEDVVCDDQALVDELGVVDEPYSATCGFIMNAIDSLSELAETDQVARDAIANLSVVLFDLK